MNMSTLSLNYSSNYSSFQFFTFLNYSVAKYRIVSIEILEKFLVEAAVVSDRERPIYIHIYMYIGGKLFFFFVFGAFNYFLSTLLQKALYANVILMQFRMNFELKKNPSAIIIII